MQLGFLSDNKRNSFFCRRLSKNERKLQKYVKKIKF